MAASSSGEQIPSERIRPENEVEIIPTAEDIATVRNGVPKVCLWYGKVASKKIAETARIASFCIYTPHLEQSSPPRV